MNPTYLIPFAPLFALGQQTAPAPNAGQRETVFSVTSTLVQLDAVAIDSKGRNVSDLASDDFEVLIDGKRPGKETAAAMLAHKVAIGRSWSALPHHVRVTIGTREEMEKFKTAFLKVMA